MREIKFRAYCSLTKSMINDYCVLKENEFIGYDMTNNTHYIESVMQSTGLYDKNGREIYEGDIVAWFFIDEYVSYKVEFISGMFALHINGGNYPLGEYVEQDDFKRIGNIHENPELLEEK